LVFVAAIFGNFSQYIDSLGQTPYTNDFKLVTGISTVITCYVLFVPMALYVILYYRNAAIQYGFVELVALYGYSLSIFIPVSILWVFHYQWFRWALIAVSVSLSGFVLVSTIWDAIKSDKNKLVAFGVVFGVLFLHSALAIGMKEYYFDTILPAKQEAYSPAPPIKTTLISLVAEKPKADALLAPELPSDSLKLPNKEEAMNTKLNSEKAAEVKADTKTPDKADKNDGSDDGNQTKTDVKS